jgi:hypothetical protein
VLSRDSPSSDAGVAGGAVLVLIVGGAGAATTAGSATPMIAATIAGIVALAVARITAVTTNRRQAEQLAAEDGRLRRQLAHDRDLRELAHLREFFDECAAALEQWLELQNQYGHTLQHDPDNSLAVAKLRLACVSSYSAAVVLARRMALRLPPTHPLYAAFLGAISTYEEWQSAMNNATTEGPTWDESKDQERAHDQIRDGWQPFADLAREELDRRAAVAAA